MSKTIDIERLKQIDICDVAIKCILRHPAAAVAE